MEPRFYNPRVVPGLRPAAKTTAGPPKSSREEMVAFHYGYGREIQTKCTMNKTRPLLALFYVIVLMATSS